MIERGPKQPCDARCRLCGALRLCSLILEVGWVCLRCQTGEPELTNELPAKAA